MSDFIPYRATDPKAVAESLEAYQRARDAFFGFVEEFSKDRLGGIELCVVSNKRAMWANHLGTKINGEDLDGRPVWSHGGLIQQFGEHLRLAEIPDGWHFYVKEKEVRPHASGRTRAARDAVEAVRGLNASSPGDLRSWISKHFGVPQQIAAAFGFEPIGDDFFVLRGRTMFDNEWEGNEHFEKVKRSTFWIAREEAEESPDVPS